MACSLDGFVEKTKDLLETERLAEITQTTSLHEQCSNKELERQGVLIQKLHLTAKKTGLFGRSILVFESHHAGKELPAHSFTPGDIGGLYLSSGDNSKQQIVSGIVNKTSSTSISLACDESWENLDVQSHQLYRLMKLANDVTYKRLKRSLKDLSSYRSGPASHMIDVMFDVCKPSPPYGDANNAAAQGNTELQFFNEHLDTSQKEAVQFSLNQREVAIIHGPPGTGKTTTVVEVIRQAVARKLKILTCAPSNIAVDNLVERLAASGVHVIRLGHPARLLPSTQNHTLDAVLARSDEGQVNHEIKREISNNLNKASTARNAGERRCIYSDLKDLRSDLRKREEAATRSVLQRADVVLSTLTSATDDGPLKVLDKEHFDLIVIDECSQALEVACWIALLRAPRCILAGDHLQLPPTIMSDQAAKSGLSVTLMERLLSLHGATVMRMLCCQYRMHQDIMTWSSKQLYDNRLIAHASVQNHLLSDLPHIHSNEASDVDLSSMPLLFIDTSGCDLHELDLPDEMSKGNEGEADLVVAHVKELLALGLKNEEIAVIVPYNLQVDLLRLRLNSYTGLEVRSVDGFQGREKEAVVISMVRSNKTGEVGFLSEHRRTNVAITRARRHLCIIADSDTVSKDPYLNTLVDYLNEHAEVRSAQQYIQDGLVESRERPEHLQEKIDRAAAASGNNKKRSAKGKAGKAATASGPKQGTAATRVEDKHSSKNRDVHHDEARNEERKHQYTAEIQAFMDDRRRGELNFPAALTSYDRMLVHQICESLDLIHISVGENENRHICVKKKVFSVDPPPATAASIDEPKKSAKAKRKRNKTSKTAADTPVVEADSVDETDEKSLESTEAMNSAECDNAQSIDEIRCVHCNKLIPTANHQLHTVQCKRKAAALKTDNSAGGAVPKKGKNKKPPIKHSQLSRVEDGEDFDALIEAAIKDNKTCAFTKCKTSTLVLGQQCEFCARRFCLSHHIPEVHGCGDAAKAQARAIIRRDGVLHRGSGVPSKKPDPVTKAHLQRKLAKKLDDMNAQRSKKQKDKDK